MKIKFLALSVIMAGASMFANAQETENYYTKKATDNIFFGFGIGGMSVINGGFNTPTLNLNIQLGKYITPTWGVRAEISGLWQSLDKQDHNWFETNVKEYKDYCKMFGELNLDAMLNVTNWLGGYNPDRAVDFYLFAGPTMNLASKGTVFTGETSGANEAILEGTSGCKVRIGATAGLGIDFYLNNKWAINVESRFGVSPSIFGWGSDYRTAEATGRLTIGAKYTFNGINFCKPVSEEAVEKIVEKEVDPNMFSYLETYDNKDFFDPIAALALIAMINEANKNLEGDEKILVSSAYRSFSYQEGLHEKYIDNYMDEHDVSEEEAREQTLLTSAPAGKSEHHSGLCVDLVESRAAQRELDETFEDTEAFAWLSQNAHKYGFILRYPKDKTDITKYSYEPWHYRFVGVYAATIIYEDNITLEEYLADFE